MEVPLTSFVDFILKTGRPKLTCAKDIKTQINEGYSPATDYYKRFRESVQKLHQGGLPKSELMKIIGRLPENKIESYGAMVAGYKKFLGKKEVDWFQPPRKIWTYDGLQVPVNPELGLEWGGQKYLIKLYLKSAKPSKDKLSSILALMNEALNSPDSAICCLDVRNGKLHLFEEDMVNMLPLVEAEARALESILNRI